ncbi:hypothetical protein SNE40_008389 [Patella caerulea]|uniref:Signal recognition particle subunit SRP72 n=1 Tax=Patella caerulea TaxID=87958 RepID=A0AAN8K158_PATCE
MSNKSKKTKEEPKPDKETQISTLYGDLHRLGQKQEYAKAIKICNQILGLKGDEVSALQYKISCQMLTDQFENALGLIQKNKITGMDFEKAYCQYRLNKTNDALKTLRAVSQLDYRMKELLAQVLYRREEYQECYDLYRDLVKNSDDDFDTERQTNMAAVIASLEMWTDKTMDDPGFEEDSYEICYNKACQYIGKDDLKTAADKLKKAEDILRADPELAEDELEEELGLIRVQQGYVLQRENKPKEASELYNLCMKSKPTDLGLLAVVSNNIVTINKDQNMFDSKKKLKAATGENVQQKLTDKQKGCIAINQCLLNMYAGQGDQCHELADALIKQYPDIDTPVLIKAAQLVKEKKLEQAVELLREYVEKHPDQSFSLQLVISQLYLTQGAVYPACDTLKSLGVLRYKPGIISALVTLYISQEDREAASDVLMDAVNWYKANQPKSEDLITITRANADFQLKIGKPQNAATMLEALRKVNPKDPRVLAQLISAYSTFDTNKAQQLSKELPPIEEIAKDVDVAGLESSFSTLGHKYMKKIQKTEASPAINSGDVLIQKKKSKKKKKGKLPKDYDPNTKPADLDQERWLPRRERSYYRGKRRDKKRDIGKGTQGSSGPAGDMDASKASPAASSPRSAASPSVSEGPRQQRPGQANKKRGKKGRR